MDSRSAAARGTIVAASWAATLFSLLAAARTIEHQGGLLALADIVFERSTFDAGPGYVIAASILAAGLVGAGMGLLGRTLQRRPWARVVLLALASLPGLFAAIWVALTVISIPPLSREGTVSLLLAPIGALLYAAYGTVFAAPILLPPALLAASMIEGWTRPESWPRHGMASPWVRGAIMHVLVVAIAAFTTFAVLRWPRS